MILSASQLAALKADVLSDGTLSQIDHTSNAGYILLAAAYNVLASPVFWVWRTSVTRADIYHTTSIDGTTWNWSTYKAQAATEQNAWVQMFMGDTVNFALANLRVGIAAIFTGNAAQNAQQLHCLTIGRRTATRAEKLFSTGTGSTASPAVMGAEGAMIADNISQAFS